MSKQTKQEKSDIQKARLMAKHVVEHHFGESPKRLLHKAEGLTNSVFLAAVSKGEFFVRLNSEPGKISTYIKEQWVVSQAVKLGIPTQEILEVGNEVVPCPYMISRRVKGINATEFPDKQNILFEMGRYASLINSIKTNCYGYTFDWSRNKLSRNSSWKNFLKEEYFIDQRLDLYKKYQMVNADTIKALRSVMLSADKKIKNPSLNHSDIRLKNVIVDRSGTIVAILDWEDCISSLAPAWELSISMHDLSIDDKQRFLEGYGISSQELIKLSPIMNAINILNYAPAIERIIIEKNKTLLDFYRARLNGAMDLFSV